MHSPLHSGSVCIIYKITLSAAERKRWLVKMYFIKIAWFQPQFCHFRHFCLVFGGQTEFNPLRPAQMRAHIQPPDIAELLLCSHVREDTPQG